MKIAGNEIAPGAVLIAANHTSWLDIVVLSALAPVSFVAKREVGGWPFVGWLARLQRTVFVDRERRGSAGETADEIRDRLVRGDKLVLFAEGTSSDGNRVLPFRSALFGAVVPIGTSVRDDARPAAVVQAVSLAYTRLHGVPLTRSEKPVVGWYGDMEMGSHAWQLLKAGPLDAEIRVGSPVPIDRFGSRKALTRAMEAEVREGLARILLGRADADPVEVAAAGEGVRRTRRGATGTTVKRPFT